MNGKIFANPLIHITILILALFGLFAYGLHIELLVAKKLGFVLDDSWIHAAIARNLVEGKGFSINPGETLPISTAPLWTLLVALFYLFVKDAVIATLTASTICFTACCVLLYKIIQTLTESKVWAFFGTALFVMMPFTEWGLLSGMEIPVVFLSILFVISVCLYTELGSVQRKILLPLSLALAGAARPELFILAPITLGLTLLAEHKSSRSGLLHNIAHYSLSSLVFFAPYFVFNLLTLGKPLPTTFYAKVTTRGISSFGSVEGWGLMNLAIKKFVALPIKEFELIIEFINKENFLFVLLAPIGLLAFTKFFNEPKIKKVFLIPVTLLVLPIAMGIVSPAQSFSNAEGRYFAPYIPFFVILAPLGLSVLVKKFEIRYITTLFVIAAFLELWLKTPREIILTARQVDTVNRLYTDTRGKWINEHTDPNAVFAVNDIGGFAYFSDRKIIDIMGLASPDIWPVIKRDSVKQQNIKKLRRYLKDSNIDYLLVSPKYYPHLTDNHEIFVPLKKWRERYPSNRQISPQILYKIDRVALANHKDYKTKK